MKKNIILLFSILFLTNYGFSQKDIYSIKLNDAYGKPINLEDFKGKKMLFVNVASKCGYTKQYDELQKLYEKHKNKLVIIGLPCNQFMGQEPGKSEEVAKFCRLNYGVQFLISEKIKVKGGKQHPIYSWLTDEKQNGVLSSSVKWNFQKYLVDENGKLVKYWAPAVKPMDADILKNLY